jgi:hypothetical protein
MGNKTYIVGEFVHCALEDVLIVRLIAKGLRVNQADLILWHVVDVADLA